MRTVELGYLKTIALRDDVNFLSHELRPVGHQLTVNATDQLGIDRWTDGWLAWPGQTMVIAIHRMTNAKQIINDQTDHASLYKMTL